MSRECIVHFKLIRDHEVKELRGLIFVASGQEPSIEQLIECFASMGYQVKLEDERKLIFKSTRPSESFTLEVTSFDLGEEKEDKPDRTVRAIASNFIKKQPPIS